MYAEEEKEFLVFLSIPVSPVADGEERLVNTSLVDVSCFHKGSVSMDTVQVEGERVQIRRPPTLSQLTSFFPEQEMICVIKLEAELKETRERMETRELYERGYLAPEYAMRGLLTEKADVFGFGVVALEIISGRANSDNSLDDERVYLLEWAWTLYESSQSLLMMDPSLTEFDESEALRVIGVALLCTQASPAMRPTMSRVVAMLAGDIEVSPVKSKPSYLTDMDFKDITGRFRLKTNHPLQLLISRARTKAIVIILLI
ncbi:LRR receptor serine/threonine-protein kinase [Salix suchowensis]|nr:LRR receptor serine/threonine-protein kinase [Salix suchowensis]